MGIEIERKFLVTDESWREGAEGTLYRQGYLSTDTRRAVRVRLAGKDAFLTVKGRGDSLTRLEFEYPLPVADAREILDKLCRQPLIEKVRYKVVYENHLWEIDVFQGANQGLIVAEIELNAASQSFPKPPWAGEEVTHDPRYLNANLVSHPFTRW